MNVILYSFIVLWCILFLLLLRQMHRNQQVYDFMWELSGRINIRLKEKIHSRVSIKSKDEFLKDMDEYRLLEKTLDALYDRYSYSNYLWSFKPLKLEAWFTEDEVKLLTTPQK